jgi:hypothetical protein
MLTRMSVIMTLKKDTHTCQNHTLRVEITLVCDVHTHTVMNTRTSVIYERKVWFQHARVWFIYLECNFYTQSVIATRRVWFPNAVWFWHAQMWLRHLQLWFQQAQNWFLHAECDVDTYECDYGTCTCQNYNLPVEITICLFCVIFTRILWWTHARM